MRACGIDREYPVWTACRDCRAVARGALPVYCGLHCRSADRDADVERDGAGVLCVSALAEGGVPDWRVAVGDRRCSGLVDPAAAGAGTAVRRGAAGDVVRCAAGALAQPQPTTDVAAGADCGPVRGAPAGAVDRTQLAYFPHLSTACAEGCDRSRGVGSRGVQPLVSQLGCRVRIDGGSVLELWRLSNPAERSASACVRCGVAGGDGGAARADY